MPNGFSGKTLLERLNSKEYMLRSSLSFENDVMKVTCKNGLVTDGASIPRAFWAVIGSPFSGKYVGSAIIHDGLYKSHKLSRAEADELFNQMLVDNGVWFPRRFLMGSALWAFGWISYNAKSPFDISECAKLVQVKYKPVPKS
jgi:hypothetical protein